MTTIKLELLNLSSWDELGFIKLLVEIKSLLNAASITADHIRVNVAELFNAAEGVNAASEEVSTVELVSTAYMIDYALWEVIENGATLPKTAVVEGVEKKRDLVGMQLLRRLKRNLLKQQYENFTAPSSEMLDQTFDMLKKLIGQLELLDEKLSQEDVNQNMDDLYKNIKVYKLEVKGISSSSSSTQNMAFVSSLNNNTSSSNKAVNATHGVTTASTQVNTTYSTNIDNLSDAVIFSFFASQPNSPQLAHEDLQQINAIHPENR
ncbi:hypothetical protein Tco_1485060 [Tanacetum coccineum]